MVSPVIYEGWYSAGFLASEMPNTGSRDTVLFDNTAGGTDLLVQGGTVFSYEGYGTPVASAKSGNTGAGTFTGIAVNPVATQIGVYTATFTSSTAYTVTAPDGTTLNSGTTGVPYLDQIGFLITAGGTAFAVGDYFTITTSIGALPVIAAKSGIVGNGTCTLAEVWQQAAGMLGNYQLVFTSAGATGAFSVTAPDGRQLSAGAAGTTYDDEITFLLSTTTNWAIGDTLTVGITPGTGYATFWTGAYPAAGVIFNRLYVTAGTTKKLTAITRNAEVIGANLQFLATPSAAGLATAKAQLKALGIVVR